MRHTWLTLAVVASVMMRGDVAQAKRIMCTCGQPGVAIPERAAGDADFIAPAAPRDVRVSIVGHGHSELDIESITMFGGYPPDAAVIRVELRDARGSNTLLTTPSRLYLCEPGMRLAAGPVTATITAFDAAGNASTPLVTAAEVIVTRDWQSQCGPDAILHRDGFTAHPRHHGHGFEILLVLMVPLGLMAWVVVVIFRRMTVKRYPAEPVSLLQAEEVARRLLRWQVVWTAMLIAATFGVVYRVDDDLWIPFAPFLFSALGQLVLQRRALRLLDRPETDAVRRGRWLVVTSLRDSVMVRASNSDFVQARREAVPRSIVK